jgi:hypothetical protein
VHSYAWNLLHDAILLRETLKWRMVHDLHFHIKSALVNSECRIKAIQVQRVHTHVYTVLHLRPCQKQKESAWHTSYHSIFHTPISSAKQKRTTRSRETVGNLHEAERKRLAQIATHKTPAVKSLLLILHWASSPHRPFHIPREKESQLYCNCRGVHAGCGMAGFLSAKPGIKTARAW